MLTAVLMETISNIKTSKQLVSIANSYIRGKRSFCNLFVISNFINYILITIADTVYKRISKNSILHRSKSISYWIC